MTDILKLYLQKIRDNYGSVDARGVMQVYRVVELPIDEIFVNLTVQLRGQESEPRQRGFDSPKALQSVGPETRAEKPSSLWLEKQLDTKKSSLSLDDLWERNELWVLLGDPGSGKTTVLKHLALKQVKTFDSGLAARLPILVTLRFFWQTWAQNSSWEPPEAVMSYLAGPGATELGFDSEASDNLIALFRKVLTEKNALLLFDGLDEQRDVAMKQQTATAIEQLLKQYPGNQCMVTSRIIGYDAAPLGKGFETATLEPFNDEQMDKFFHNWLYAIESREDLIKDEATKRRAEEKARDLIEQVNAKQGIKALATNPLLCTIIGLIHRQGAALPNQRAELYKLCIDTFIFNWEMHKRRMGLVQDSLDKDETQAVLEEIALHFHEHCPENRASRDKILEVTQKFLIRDQDLPDTEAHCKATRLVDLISQVAGLLIDRGNEEYGFFHLTFQEYLAARAITRRREDIERYLKQYLFDPRWREVICLAAIHQGMQNKQNGSEFIKAIQRHPHQREEEMRYTFRMAFLCAAETQVELATANELFQRWVKLYWEQPHLQELLLHLVQRPGARIQYRSGLQPLLEKLKDNDIEVRFKAAQALSALKASEALPALRAARNDPDAGVRGKAIEALGTLKDREVLPTIREALRDGDSWVHARAVEAIKSLEDREALPALRAELKDRDAGVRGRAAEALGVLKDHEALSALCEALWDEDSWVRTKAAEAIKALGDREVLPALRETLKNEDPMFRVGAAYALGVLKAPGALSALREAMLNERDIKVRFRAAHALGLLKDREALPTLYKALEYREEARVRSDAAHALGVLKAPEALSALREAMLNDGVAWVRGSAVEALSALKDPTILPDLCKVLKEDKSGWVRDRAAQALGALQKDTEETLSALREAIKTDKDPPVRFSAARALGLLKDCKALYALCEVLRRDVDSWVRGSAAQALSALKDPETLPALRAALGDRASWVRERAAEAIELIELGSNL